MHYWKECFYAEALRRMVCLYVGLPDSYTSSNAPYPVLYAHDGENLFSSEDSFSGHTWKIMEAFQDNADLPEVVIVGISSARGLGRVDEYSPYSFTVEDLYPGETLGGYGDMYLDYFFNTLKPWIERRWNVSRRAEAIGMMGSSLGALITLYALLKRNDAFSRAACLSGAYFVSLQSLMDDIERYDVSRVRRLYMDVGTEEKAVRGPEMYLSANKSVDSALRKKFSASRYVFRVIEKAKHDEKAWAERVPDVIRFLFGERGNHKHLI